MIIFFMKGLCFMIVGVLSHFFTPPLRAPYLRAGWGSFYGVGSLYSFVRLRYCS